MFGITAIKLLENLSSTKAEQLAIAGVKIVIALLLASSIDNFFRRPIMIDCSRIELFVSMHTSIIIQSQKYKTLEKESTINEQHESLFAFRL